MTNSQGAPRQAAPKPDLFAGGVLCALACVAAQEGDESTLYREIVFACGPDDLLREAEREDDSQLPGIRKYIAWEREQKRIRSRMERFRRTGR